MIGVKGKKQKQALRIREHDQIAEAPVDRRDPEDFSGGGHLLPMKASGGGSGVTSLQGCRFSVKSDCWAKTLLLNSHSQQSSQGSSISLIYFYQGRWFLTHR